MSAGFSHQRIVAALVEVGRSVAAAPGPHVVLADRRDVTVVGVGGCAVKLHSAATCLADLTVQLAIAADPALADALLAPIPLPANGFTTTIADRPVTVWPLGTPVDPDDPDSAPWQHGAELLARLHRAPLPTGRVPQMGGPARVADAVTRLRGSRAVSMSQARTVLDAYETLPAWTARGGPAPAELHHCLVHGDWHLGQLVRVDDTWRLIDVDDLGIGPAAWDLAHPAAWTAVGMLAPEDWQEFLDAYRHAGGPAIPAGVDPWSVLDLPARAITVQAAARGILAAAAQDRELDEVEELLIESCRGIVRMGTIPEVP